MYGICFYWINWFKRSTFYFSGCESQKNYSGLKNLIIDFALRPRGRDTASFASGFSFVSSILLLCPDSLHSDKMYNVRTNKNYVRGLFKQILPGCADKSWTPSHTLNWTDDSVMALCKFNQLKCLAPIS